LSTIFLSEQGGQSARHLGYEHKAIHSATYVSNTYTWTSFSCC